jgi:hypothetical protein
MIDDLALLVHPFNQTELNRLPKIKLPEKCTNYVCVDSQNGS